MSSALPTTTTLVSIDLAKLRPIRKHESTTDAAETTNAASPLTTNEPVHSTTQTQTPPSPSPTPSPSSPPPAATPHDASAPELNAIAVTATSTATATSTVTTATAAQISADVLSGGNSGGGGDDNGNGNNDASINGMGISLMQSSPPPHSYRHSRAYRHFKNPPQPHMCIRTTTEIGEELFINVLSWTRIVIPQEPSDPIPLYGGMRVPPGSPRSPPIVFAVMANPEVLKDSGRHSKDPEERRAMVELMCDFVEAMNPGVKLVRYCIRYSGCRLDGVLSPRTAAQRW